MSVLPVDIDLTTKDKTYIMKATDYILGSIFDRRITKECRLRLCIRYTDTDVSFQLANYSSDNSYPETRICFLIPQEKPIVAFFKEFTNYFKEKEGNPNIILINVEFKDESDVLKQPKKRGERVDPNLNRIFRGIEFFNMSYLDLTGVVHACIFQ